MIKPEDIHFKLATTQVDMMHVAAIRGICNLEEVGVPAAHEFDENDNFATHALGYVGDEPVSTVRLRFFGDFVKGSRVFFTSLYSDDKLSKYSWLRTFGILNILMVIILPLNFIIGKGSNYMYLYEVPQIKNPLVFGDWPFYIINWEVIILVLFYLTYLIFTRKRI